MGYLAAAQAPEFYTIGSPKAPVKISLRIRQVKFENVDSTSGLSKADVAVFAAISVEMIALIAMQVIFQ